MGTGVGEAMIIGAVTGAGTSAITGGDPLKGALLGAAGGGVGAGIAGAGTGAATGASGVAPVSSVSTTGAAAGSGIGGAAPITSVGLPEAVGQVGMSTLPSGATVPSTMLSSGDISMLAPKVTPVPTATAATPTAAPGATFPSVNQFYAKNPILMPAGLGAATSAIGQMYDQEGLPPPPGYSGPLSRFRYDPDKYRTAMASGGLADTAAAQRYMKGGHLGSYSDGGRLLKGPGDGMSDSIPAKIGAKQPARLADGEFVVPADVVSGLGNGSTDAGARKLYAMMDKVRKSRTGSKRQGKEINPNKYLPA